MSADFRSARPFQKYHAVTCIILKPNTNKSCLPIWMTRTIAHLSHCTPVCVLHSNKYQTRYSTKSVGKISKTTTYRDRIIIKVSIFRDKNAHDVQAAAFNLRTRSAESYALTSHHYYCEENNSFYLKVYYILYPSPERSCHTPTVALVVLNPIAVHGAIVAQRGGFCTVFRQRPPTAVVVVVVAIIMIALKLIFTRTLQSAKSEKVWGG